MVKILIGLSVIALLIALFTPLWPPAVVVILFVGAILVIKESKEKRHFFATALSKGLNRGQATKWLEYNEKKMPSTASEWKEKADFIAKQDDSYIFDYRNIKPGSYATQKWIPFVACLIVFCLIVVGGVALSKRESAPVQYIPAATTSTTTAAPDQTTVAPSGQTFTSCNPDGSGGQNCTSNSPSGIKTSHCYSNGMGGMNCN